MYYKNREEYQRLLDLATKSQNTKNPRIGNLALADLSGNFNDRMMAKAVQFDKDRIDYNNKYYRQKALTPSLTVRRG